MLGSKSKLREGKSGQMDKKNLESSAQRESRPSPRRKEAAWIALERDKSIRVGTDCSSRSGHSPGTCLVGRL